MTKHAKFKNPKEAGLKDEYQASKPCMLNSKIISGEEETYALEGYHGISKKEMP